MATVFKERSGLFWRLLALDRCNKILLKPLARNGGTLSKYPIVPPNNTVCNAWRDTQKRHWIKHFGSAETQVAFFLAARFLHTSNGFSMILTHAKCVFGCRGAKSLFLHRFYKQNESACILWFGVLGGLEGALHQACFSIALKPQRGSKYYPETLFFAL